MLLPLALVICALPRFVADETFDSKGVKIRYVTAGEGEPVVLIHGWMGDSSTWGRDAAGNTKLDVGSVPGFQFVALDCRGHGKSDKPHEREKYGAQMAEDVVRLLDHLKLKKAHLVGYSMGAFIAGNVAAKHPDRVISVVYGGQAPLIAGEANGSAEVEAFAKAAEGDGDMGEYFRTVTPPDRPKPTLEQANVYAKLMFNGKDLKALAAAGRSFPELAVKRDDLKKISARAIFLYGEKDPSRSRIEALQKSFPGSGIKMIPKADHMTTLGNREFWVTLIEFLHAHKARSIAVASLR